jgi:hypothetical protein
LLFGVEELKKVLQLVVISATVADEPPDAAAEAAVDAADDAVAGADDAGAVDEEEEELEPLEQADMAAMSTRPSVGAKQIRRAVGLIRIVTRPFGRRSLSVDLLSNGRIIP